MNPSSQNLDQGRHSEGALGPYLRSISAHRALVIIVTLATIAASVLWVTVRSSNYESSANLLVTPLPQEDETFLGLEMIRDSGDPTRTVQTAATLVESAAAARRAAAVLGKDWSADRVLDAISVNPEGESNVLAVTATADQPELSARLANVFARAALSARAELLTEQASLEIARLKARLDGPPNEPATVAADERISQLEAVQSTGDPTLTLSQPAVPPGSAADMSAAIIIVLAAIAGFVLGSGAAFVLESTRREVRDEEEVLELYRLPVLTRTPVLKGKDVNAWSGSSWRMPPVVWEAFRTLLIQLDGMRKSTDRTPACLVASASAGDGKTTSAVNLAVAAASGGQSVALLDFDLRKPDVGEALHVTKRHRVTELLATDAKITSLIKEQPAIPRLSVLAVEAEESDVTHIEELAQLLPKLVDEARDAFDLVVIDTAPLGQISDALRLVEQVDAVFIVTRPGHTLRAEFETMRDLLERMQHAPTGLIVIGNYSKRGTSYYDYAALERPLFTTSRQST